MVEHVYFVQRHDHEHHTDRKGRMTAISIHRTLAGANAAARNHMERESRKVEPGMEPGIDIEELTGDGRFHCQVQTFQGKRDHFIIKVKQMVLHDDGAAAAPGPVHGNENDSPNGRPAAAPGSPHSNVNTEEVICLD